MQKIENLYKDASPAVYNLSLDQNLKKFVQEKTQKAFPFLLRRGKWNKFDWMISIIEILEKSLRLFKEIDHSERLSNTFSLLFSTLASISL